MPGAKAGLTKPRVEWATSDLSWREAYKFLIGSILPRPIGWISSIDEAGIANLAPFSFFNAVCPNPMTVAFSPNGVKAPGEGKDTLRNVEATGEFVVNIVTAGLAAAMNATSATFASEVDEFAACGLVAEPSVAVRPPRVAESPIHFECRVLHVLHFGDGNAGGGSLVVGQVVHVHVADALLDRGRIVTKLLEPVGRLAGNEYCRVTDVFDLIRPD